MDLLNKIPKDKLLHFFVGSIILFLSLLVFNTIVSVFIVVFAAVVKEVVWDNFLEKGNPEMLDFVYSILPCFFYLINTVILK